MSDCERYMHRAFPPHWTNWSDTSKPESAETFRHRQPAIGYQTAHQTGRLELLMTKQARILARDSLPIPSLRKVSRSSGITTAVYVARCRPWPPDRPQTAPWNLRATPKVSPPVADVVGGIPLRWQDQTQTKSSSRAPALRPTPPECDQLFHRTI